MLVGGNRISAWWLLLLIPILPIGVPSLLILFFALNNFAGVIFGPPAIWSRTWNAPPSADLVGRYVESERHWDRDSPHAPAMLLLNNDSTTVVRNLPFEFGEMRCLLTGLGKWQQSGSGGDQRIWLVYTASQEGANVCKSGSYDALELAGHSKPYSLYWILGDPDSGIGVWFKREP
jgi:hypothetical protein